MHSSMPRTRLEGRKSNASHRRISSLAMIEHRAVNRQGTLVGEETDPLDKQATALKDCN